MLAAATQNPLALRLAGASLKVDPEMVLAAVQKSGSALEHAEGGLKADRKVVQKTGRR